MPAMSLCCRILLSCLLAMYATACVAADGYSIGVYYFPGWRENQIGAPRPKPWEPIKAFPEREPMLGWYDDGSEAVIAKQIGWMHQYGIDFVVFDWLIGRDDVVRLDHSLNAYLRLKNKQDVGFAIMWANHTDYDFTKPQFEKMFRLWATRYFARPEYEQLDGKPVVYIFSADVLNRNAMALGMSSAQFAQWADQVVKSAGGVGVRIVGGTWGGRTNGFDYSANSGYAGFTAYNLHSPATKRYQGNHVQAHSYAELDEGYRDQWQWLVKHVTGASLVLPITAGWDRRAWGGSTDPQHDNSRGTPAEFEAHLRAAKSAMDGAANLTRKTGIVCCWNEYGEGSVIEPTKKQGFAYLEAIRKVFGGPAN